MRGPWGTATSSLIRKGSVVGTFNSAWPLGEIAQSPDFSAPPHPPPLGASESSRVSPERLPRIHLLACCHPSRAHGADMVQMRHLLPQGCRACLSSPLLPPRSLRGQGGPPVARAPGAESLPPPLGFASPAWVQIPLQEPLTPCSITSVCLGVRIHEMGTVVSRGIAVAVRGGRVWRAGECCSVAATVTTALRIRFPDSSRIPIPGAASGLSNSSPRSVWPWHLHRKCHLLRGTSLVPPRGSGSLGFYPPLFFIALDLVRPVPAAPNCFTPRRLRPGSGQECTCTPMCARVPTHAPRTRSQGVNSLLRVKTHFTTPPSPGSLPSLHPRQRQVGASFEVA